MTLYHVLPINDLKEHIESENCHCNPRKTIEGVIVHNSFDRREDFEELRRM